MALRPEKIWLGSETPAESGNCVRGVVKAFSYFGDCTMYHLELASGAKLKVLTENDRRQGAVAYGEGDAVWAWWQPDAQIVLTE